MATRNERKRKAKAREAALRKAVSIALALEASRPLSRQERLAKLAREYPTSDECFDVHGWRGQGSPVASDKAKLTGRQSLPKPVLATPLKGDAYDNKGESMRRWTDGKKWQVKH